MSDTELTKVPFIYKGTNKYNGLIKIKSVYTTDHAEITFARLKYFVKRGQIELLNARLTDDGQVIVTDEFTRIKTQKLQVNKLLYGEIDNPEILTPTQQEISAVFDNTLLEIDTAKTSIGFADAILSKPLSICDGKFNVQVYLCEHVTHKNLQTLCNGHVHVYKNDRYLCEIRIVIKTRDQLPSMISLLNYLTDDYTAPNKLLGNLLSEYASGYVYDITAEDVDQIYNICEHFHITKQYAEILQTRINNVKKETDLILKLAEIAKRRYGLDQPDLETMILCFSFCRAYGGIKHKITIIDQQASQFSQEAGMKYAIETYSAATEFAKHQKLTELFNLTI